MDEATSDRYILQASDHLDRIATALEKIASPPILKSDEEKIHAALVTIESLAGDPIKSRSLARFAPRVAKIHKAVKVIRKVRGE